ncbi:MAG: AAA family ATPase [Patescibacteria group bacterium]|nr:AAA family ATPase [Patescibacteria group bacterium]
MRLTSIELSGFKSFAKKTELEFGTAITAVVGPNGSGKSNIAESFRFVLGEQSMKSMRGKRGEDLIWNGSASSPRAGKAGVKLVFDNADRALSLDFDEVSLERVVHRDGVNDYLLNGSIVRLRDIAELLSQANIGSSGHHIISQGEADRVLSAGSRERREMLEDALGLTAYLYKREEAQRKLEKTGENMREVEALRRELAPHLKFLSSQVKKIEESEKLRDELVERYVEYLTREHHYITHTREALMRERAGPEQELADVEHSIKVSHTALEKKPHDVHTQELIDVEKEGQRLSTRRREIERELGRVEGRLLAEVHAPGASVPLGDAKDFGQRVLSLAQGGSLADLVALAKEFLQKLALLAPKGSGDDLAARKRELEHELEQLSKGETRASETIAKLRRSIESSKDESRAAERKLFEAMAQRSGLQAALSSTRAREEVLNREEAAFKSAVAEAGALCGPKALAYKEFRVSGEEVRDAQEDRRKKIERLKIKLEDGGLGEATDVLREHKETVERDAFLARELNDLAGSIEKLNHLIGELTETLEKKFTGGVEKINKEFDAFFKLMFGGGSASLSIVKERRLKRSVPEEGGESDEDEIEEEEGVEISVTIPHKRVKGLHMLSGGERALTSIALIFAMSQVNPPPFLILDETDAALDEANSRRYGDMIESLAKKSQLILITHNRETMSRAGVLYGVTMGNDGVSKLLSVKFEEALAVAK